MPTSAQPIEHHGDPTSLSSGVDLSTALLRIPLEIWLHIFEGEIKVTDLTHLRSISKTFWAVAERLMPHVAARLHPSHADDPRINDAFFAEAVIAAHRLNVRSPFEVLVSRGGDTSIASGRPLAGPNGASAITETSELADGSEIVSIAEADAIDKLPTRADWIIGSRRMLHTIYASGRGGCSAYAEAAAGEDAAAASVSSRTFTLWPTLGGVGRPRPAQYPLCTARLYSAPIRIFASAANILRVSLSKDVTSANSLTRSRLVCRASGRRAAPRL